VTADRAAQLKAAVGCFVILMIGKRLAKIAIVLAFIVAGGIASYHCFEWMLDRAIMNGMCGNTVLAESRSPDGQWKAIVFGRSCGATTGVSTQVSILPLSSDLPNESGNVCAVGAFPKVDVHWQSNRDLIVKHHAGAKVFPVNETLQGINIKYEVSTGRIQPALGANSY
jgi:disulfide bond formation protein DsbB